MTTSVQTHPLMTIGALDGRYRNRLEPLAPLVSEFGLIRYRVLVEAVDPTKGWINFSITETLSSDDRDA